MNLEYFLQIIIALAIIFYFIKKYKTKNIFIFYAILFYILSLILQIPIKYLELMFLNDNFLNTIPIFFTIIISIIISELIKYFSLKKNLKTKSYKNGILFLLVWISLESINIFSILFYKYFFSIFSISFNYTYLINPNLNLINFIYFYIINIGISIMVLYSIIKKQKIYLFSAIFYSSFIYLSLYFFTGLEKLIIILLSFCFSLFTCLFYKKIIK